MVDIGNQIAYISACKQMESAKEVADLFINPPIHAFKALDFDRFDELKQLGVEHGKLVILPWFDEFLKTEKGEMFKWLDRKNRGIVKKPS